MLYLDPSGLIGLAFFELVWPANALGFLGFLFVASLVFSIATGKWVDPYVLVLSLLLSIGDGMWVDPYLLVVMLLIYGIIVAPHWYIFRRAGWSPWWALLTGVPVVGYIFLFAFAFMRWPVERRS